MKKKKKTIRFTREEKDTLRDIAIMVTAAALSVTYCTRAYGWNGYSRHITAEAVYDGNFTYDIDGGSISINVLEAPGDCCYFKRVSELGTKQERIFVCIYEQVSGTNTYGCYYSLDVKKMDGSIEEYADGRKVIGFDRKKGFCYEDKEEKEYRYAFDVNGYLVTTEVDAPGKNKVGDPFEKFGNDLLETYGYEGLLKVLMESVDIDTVEEG